MSKLAAAAAAAAAISLSLALQLCCDASISSEHCRPDESIALLQFKNSFVGGVLNDDRMATWKEGSDCCLWEGVTCDHFTSHVVGLHLDCPFDGVDYTHCRETTTALHPDSSLFHLRHLRSLDLSRNGFQGSTIPSNFTQLTNLAHLNLSRSRFSGHIPLGFSHLNKLVSLDLSFNGPNGGDQEKALSFADNHGFSNLLLNATGLSKLVLHYMDMSNIKPSSFSNLSRSLTYIELAECGLAGNFPESVFRLPNLRVFVLEYNPLLSVQFPLSNNNLSGEIPACLTNLIQLSTLQLRMNNLHGSFPSVFGNMSSLENLDLNGNALGGSLSQSLTACKKLEVLDVGNNEISGVFPHWLSSLPVLKSESSHLALQQFPWSYHDRIYESCGRLLHVADIGHFPQLLRWSSSCNVVSQVPEHDDGGGVRENRSTGIP